MKRIMKKVLILLLIIMIISPTLSIYIPISNASLVGNVRSDAGPAPNPSTPPDSGGGSIPGGGGGSEPVSEDITEIIEHYVGITGNVYEQLSSSRTDYDINNIPENGEIPNANIGVGNVMVLVDGVVRTTTGPDGSYSLNGLAPGSHNLQFIYGKIDGNPDATTVANKRNILKYNGHDYITLQAPSGADTVNSTTIHTMTEREIIESGSGVEQVYLLVDCSDSVRTTKMMVNGVERYRFEVIIESTKKLVDSLIDSGDNIYIGLIFYSGTCYRAQGLTNDANVLKAHLDTILNNGWRTGGTNLKSALQKAEDSFLSDENKNIIIISDGVPTTDGNTVAYSDDSDAVILQKLNIIKGTTRAKLRELRDHNVTTRAIYIDTPDAEEKSFIETMFKGEPGDTDNNYVTDFLPIEDGGNFVLEIEEHLPQEIISTSEERTYSSTTRIENGVENAARRAQVDEYFKKTNVDGTQTSFYYDNGIKAKQFEQIETSYVFDNTLARELSNNTYMIVDGGTYVIDGSGGNSITRWQEEVPGSDPVRYRWHTIIHVDCWYNDRDVILGKRQSFHMKTDCTITGLKIVLADGQVLAETTRNVGSINTILQSVDDEVIYGATVEIEYTIRVSNNSSLQCNHLDIISYLPKGFKLDRETELITDNERNSDYNWNSYSMDALSAAGLITSGYPESTYEKYKDRTAVVSSWDNDANRDGADDGDSSFYIGPNGSRDIKIGITTLASNMTELSIDYDIAAEILGYRDNGINTHRRMAKSGLQNMGGNIFTWFRGLFPGNSREEDFSESSNELYILPPFGDKGKIAYFTLLTTLIGLIIIEVFIVLKIKIKIASK